MEDQLSAQFKVLLDQWGDAIANKDHDWLERHFSEDFHGTAAPWPTLVVNKRQMIDLDKAIEKMEVRWVKVTAQKVGDVVVTLGVVEYDREEFKAGATIGDGMPTGEELSALVNGRAALYLNGWRHDGEVWQIFDHHMVAVVDSEPA